MDGDGVMDSVGVGDAVTEVVGVTEADSVTVTLSVAVAVTVAEYDAGLGVGEEDEDFVRISVVLPEGVALTVLENDTDSVAEEDPVAVNDHDMDCVADNVTLHDELSVDDAV